MGETLTDKIKRYMPPRGVTASEMFEILQRYHIKDSYEEVKKTLEIGARYYRWNCDYTKTPFTYFPKTFKGG